MHTFLKTNDGKFEVGHYLTETILDCVRNEWCALFEVADAGRAAEWVNYLNGGNGEIPPDNKIEMLA